MLDVKTTVKVPKQVIKPEMLVQHEDGSIGIVTRVSRRWVHVTWLVNTDPEEVQERNGVIEEGGHHFNSHVLRKCLKPVPAGTTVTITQTEK